MIKLPVLLCSCALFAVGCASHDMGGTSEGSASTSQGSGSRVLTGGSANSLLPAADARFIREAAQSGLAEVQMGQLAQQKGQSQHLKNFGQMLVTDHQTANQELMAIASKKGVDIPTQLSASDQQTVQRLNAASGAEFDRLAAVENAQAHQKVIQMFQTAQQTVQDAELKAFIEKTLPVLESHMEHAQALQSEAGSAVGGSENLESSQGSSDGSTSSGSARSSETYQESEITPGSQAPGSQPMDQDQADQR